MMMSELRKRALSPSSSSKEEAEDVGYADDHSKEALRHLEQAVKLLKRDTSGTTNTSSATSAITSLSEHHHREDEEAMNIRKCPLPWRKNILKVIFTEKEIQTRIKELADKISKDYDGESELLIVGLLSGAVPFVSDLIRHLNVAYSIDWMKVSSYGKHTQSSGSVVMEKDMSIDPCGKHILIVDDIIDTGTTLAWLKTFLSTKGCKSVRTACLLDKKARRLAENSKILIDYAGFHCPDNFVVGYGMDFDQHYRGLPFIGILKPEAYGAEGSPPE